MIDAVDVGQAVRAHQPSEPHVLAVGRIDEHALAWLRAHSATIVDSGVVQVVVLPPGVVLENKTGPHWWQYDVLFFDDDDTCATGLVYAHYLYANESTLTSK